MDVQMIVSPWLHSVIRVTDNAKCGESSDSYNLLWRVLLLNDEAQLARRLRQSEGMLLEWDAVT